MGSEPTAASGRGREAREWQRSAENEPASTGEVFAGHRNRGAGYVCVKYRTTILENLRVGREVTVSVFEYLAEI